MKFFGFVVLTGLTVLEVLAAPPFHASQGAGSQKSKRSIPDTHVQHEKRTTVQARSWTLVQRAVPDAILPMRIGLKQKNLQSGHDLLMEMCDGYHYPLRETIANRIEDRTPNPRTMANTCLQKRSLSCSSRRNQALKP